MFLEQGHGKDKGESRDTWPDNKWWSNHPKKLRESKYNEMYHLKLAKFLKYWKD